MTTLTLRSLRGSHFSLFGCGLSALLLLACAVRAPAALDAETEQRYANQLIRIGLPAYAQIVLDRLAAEGGQTGPEYKALQLQASLTRGDFDAVKAVIAAEPNQNSLDTWAMKLTLADGYFAWGRYGEARGIYDQFFKAYKDGPPKGIETFYLNSAYKYAQMLLLMNDQKGAVEAFANALKGKPPVDAKRQIEADAAELLIKLAEKSKGEERQKYLEQADKYVEDLLWKQDVWFGKAIAMSAYLLNLRGNVEKAMKRVDYYKDTLKGIDDQLKQQSTPDEDLTSLSPMAQVRYMLGVMLHDEAKKLLKEGGDRGRAQGLLMGMTEKAEIGKKAKKLDGAIQHFLNVFIRYPNTKWATDAGTRFEEVKELLETEFGRQVKISVTPDQWARVEQEQLKAAKALFNQQQYEAAAEMYEKILNQFTGMSGALPALVDLAMCYIELGNDIYADTVIHFIAERFKHGEDMQRAGNLILNLAGSYEERNRMDRKDAVYDAFFAHFPDHPLAARLLYNQAEKNMKAGDLEAALAAYERLRDEQAGKPLSYDAMSRIASVYNQLGESAKEIKALDAYTKKLIADDRIGHDLIRGLYKLGAALRKFDEKYYPLAIKRFNEVIKRLTEDPEAYASGSEEAKSNENLLAASMYFRASCYTKLPAPEGKHPLTYKAVAIKALNDMVATFPKSELAPAALSQAGTLYTILNKAEEAEETFQKLKTDYSDSAEAKNVDFLLGMTLLELGMRERAVTVFKEMFAGGGGRFSDVQILTAGNELFKAGEYEIAVEAFDRVMSMSQERSRLEPALAGKGRALVELGRFEEGAATLEKLFETYPKTAFTVNAAFDLSRAYADIGAVEKDAVKRFDVFNKSVIAMKKVMKYEPERRVESSVEVGRILELKAIAEDKNGDKAKVQEYIDKAIAAYQAIILLENPSNPKLRPHIAKAYHQCIRLFIETERWEDALHDADRFIELFPSSKKRLLDVRQWRSRARAKLTSQGQAVDDGDAATTGDTDAGTTEVTDPDPVEAAEAAGEPVEAAAE